jgi:hypothetical protein
LALQLNFQNGSMFPPPEQQAAAAQQARVGYRTGKQPQLLLLASAADDDRPADGSNNGAAAGKGSWWGVQRTGRVRCTSNACSLQNLLEVHRFKLYPTLQFTRAKWPKQK